MRVDGNSESEKENSEKKETSKSIIYCFGIFCCVKGKNKNFGGLNMEKILLGIMSIDFILRNILRRN